MARLKSGARTIPGALAQPNPEGRCIGGLHVMMTNICQTLTVDLESTTDAKIRLRSLQARTPDQCARYVRIVVYGFAGLRAALLKDILKRLPLLHEIVLPDHARDPCLLVVLCDMIEECGCSTPRLRDVIFEDNSVQQLW